MDVRLSEEQLELLQSPISAEELEEAMTLLVLEAGQSDMDLENIQDFCQAVKDTKGDLTKLLFRTHQPVDIDTFIQDPYFLGYKIVDDAEEEEEKHNRVGIWRPLYDDIKKVIEGGYTEVVWSGATGVGKTTGAQIISGYDIYRLSCEAYPQLRFGLLPGFSIQQVCMNKTDKLAKRVTYGQYIQMLDRVRYFKEHFPRKPDNKSEMLFPKGVRVNYAPAYGDQVMGENTIGAIIDELNFMAIVKESKKQRDGEEFNQAVEVYHTVSNRLKSRYDIGSDEFLPSHLCLVSSKGYPGDFTEKRMAEIDDEKDGQSIYFNHAQWEVKKRAIFNVQPWFRVEVGSERHNTRILAKGEPPRPKSEVIKVPKFYKQAFKKNPEKALRDFAGRATLTITPFFGDRERVWEMSDLWEELGYMTPFVDRVVDLKNGYPEITEGYEVPNPECPRAAHIDLGLKRDFCGISVGHVFKTDFVRRMNPRTQKFIVEEMPFIAYDVVLTVKPPKNGEIKFWDIRSIIYMLRDMGLPIKWVTYDGFQSKDSQQLLRRKKFKTGQLSVEKIEPYDDFKLAIYDGRCAAPEHPLGFSELCKLEADYEKGNIDHLPNESKDTADSMCGVHTFLLGKRTSWKSTQIQDQADDDDDYTPRILNAQGRPVSSRPSSSRPSVGTRPSVTRR